MTRSSLAVVLAASLSVLGCGRGERPADTTRTAAGGGPAAVHPPDGPGAATAPDGAGSSGATMSKSVEVEVEAGVTVTVTVTGTRPGRPPLQRLIADVAIANPGDAPRWVTIAKQTPFDGEGGVDGLEVRGQGAALLGSFLGNAGVYALRVGAHAKVTITNLEIGWWRTSAAAAAVPPLVLAVGDELTIGGAPAKTWFGVEPLAGDGARIDGSASAAGAHSVETEQPLALAGAVPSTATLTLPAP
jgi:hypothetical protein